MELGCHHNNPILDHFIIPQNSHLLFSGSQEKVYFFLIFALKKPQNKKLKTIQIRVLFSRIFDLAVAEPWKFS